MRGNFTIAGILGCLGLFFGMFHAEAQVALSAEMTQLHYLQYEPVYVRVTMRNISGHPLAFGENQGLRGELRFEIDTPTSGRYAPLLTKETPPMRGIILQPGTSRTFTYNVTAFYDVRRPGPYTLKAVLSHPQLKSAYESNTVQFTIVSGTTIWESVVGVPKYLQKPDDTSSVIATRRYRIVSYNTGENFLYILIIEDKDKIYMVRRLGLDLGPNLRPMCAVDDLSRLNVLVAASPKVYAYYQYDVTGKLEKKEVRMKSDTTPRLVVNKDLGTVVLNGGRSARRDLDYEEIKDLPFIASAMDENLKDITEGKSIIDESNDKD